jgi:zinc/manganese transport system permease protein
MTALSLSILGPALLAGLLILATHVPLGAIVLSRGIIFIDIALAQVAALGVVFGNWMWGAWAVPISAVAAAIGCAMFLTWTDKRFHDIQEAIIGVLYIVAAALQIIVLSYSPTGSDSLKALLVGQILWVTPVQLLITAAIYAAIVAIWFFRDLARERIIFYGVLAITITVSVQIVGVLLVFSSLIIPVLATRRVKPRWRLVAAYNLGAVSYLVGLIVSAILDISSGAAIVCTLAALSVVASRFVFSRMLATDAELIAAGQMTVPHGAAAHPAPAAAAAPGPAAPAVRPAAAPVAVTSSRAA